MAIAKIDFTDGHDVIYKYTFFDDRGDRWLVQMYGKNWGAARPEEIEKKLNTGEIWPLNKAD